MQKTCKSEHCSRKFEKTSLSDLCLGCASAFKAGQIQSQRRVDNSSRQNQARSTTYDSNRDIAMSPPNTQQYLVPPPPLASQPVTGTVPPAATQATQPPIDIQKLTETFNNLGAGATTGPDPNPTMKDMFGMLLHLCSKGAESEEKNTNSQISNMILP